MSLDEMYRREYLRIKAEQKDGKKSFFTVMFVSLPFYLIIGSIVVIFPVSILFSTLFLTGVIVIYSIVLCIMYRLCGLTTEQLNKKSREAIMKIRKRIGEVVEVENAEDDDVAWLNIT